MLIPIQQLKEKFKLNITGVLEIGAHWAEEYEDFVEAGATKFIFIEPCKNAIEVLKNRVGYKDNVKIFPVACGETEGKMEMFVSNQNQGQSNSLLAPNLHLQQHPEIQFTEKEIVDVVRLDNLSFDRKDYNFLSMDCQGYEGYVIRGGKETLKHIDYVMTEVNKDSVYSNNTLIEEMDELLSDFERVEMHPWIGNWSDAFYIRKTLLENVA